MGTHRPAKDLHYNWHRHYDPTTGRYTTPDPLGFVDGPSVYAYARGNPQMYVDSDGRYVTVVIRGVVYACSKARQACVRIGKAAANAGEATVNTCFGKGGLFNNNKYLRIGRSWKGNQNSGQAFFSVRGKLLDRIMGKGRSHIDLWKWWGK